MGGQLKLMSSTSAARCPQCGRTLHPLMPHKCSACTAPLVPPEESVVVSCSEYDGPSPDTPESNAKAAWIDKHYAGDWPDSWLAFARKLERERDEARRICEAVRRGAFSFRFFRDHPLPWEKEPTINYDI